MGNEKIVRLGFLPKGNAGIIRSNGIGFYAKAKVLSGGSERFRRKKMRHQNGIKAVFFRYKPQAGAPQAYWRSRAQT